MLRLSPNYGYFYSYGTAYIVFLKTSRENNHLMSQKTVTLEKEGHYSEKDLVKAKKLVKEIEESMKDPKYKQAAKEFIKFHTGKNLRI